MSNQSLLFQKVLVGLSIGLGLLAVIVASFLPDLQMRRIVSERGCLFMLWGLTLCLFPVPDDKTKNSPSLFACCFVGASLPIGNAMAGKGFWTELNTITAFFMLTGILMVLIWKRFAKKQ